MTRAYFAGNEAIGRGCCRSDCCRGRSFGLCNEMVRNVVSMFSGAVASLVGVNWTIIPGFEHPIKSIHNVHRERTILDRISSYPESKVTNKNNSKITNQSMD